MEWLLLVDRNQQATEMNTWVYPPAILLPSQYSTQAFPLGGGIASSLWTWHTPKTGQPTNLVQNDSLDSAQAELYRVLGK